ncbi:MAG: hypothetical protein KH313_03365 [Lachnospiraceae bacterium]|jgi:hypothetical protein|nr:hypothetical protein [Lachnospiraceae bacterium]DAG13471.1 MAG TPA: hypothetical protein [Caudoviricetes sp.]
MKLLDKLEKDLINVCIISGIIVFIGIFFLGFGNENVFYKILVLSMKSFLILTSLSVIRILLQVLFKRMKEWV